MTTQLSTHQGLAMTHTGSPSPGLAGPWMRTPRASSTMLSAQAAMARFWCGGWHQSRGWNCQMGLCCWLKACPESWGSRPSVETWRWESPASATNQTMRQHSWSVQRVVASLGTLFRISDWAQFIILSLQTSRYSPKWPYSRIRQLWH